MINIYLNFSQVKYHLAVQSAWLQSNVLIHEIKVCPSRMTIQTRHKYPDCPDEDCKEIMDYTFRKAFSHQLAWMHVALEAWSLLFHILLLPSMWTWCGKVEDFMKTSPPKGWITNFGVPKWLGLIGMGFLGVRADTLLFGLHLLIPSLLFLPFSYNIDKHRYLAGLRKAQPSLLLLIVSPLLEAQVNVFFVRLQASFAYNFTIYHMSALLLWLCAVLFLKNYLCECLAVPLEETKHFPLLAPFFKTQVSAFKHPVVVDIEDPNPNAFVMGGLGSYIMGLHESLLTVLPPRGAISVIAHELGHWIHNDLNICFILQFSKIVILLLVYRTLLSGDYQILQAFGLHLRAQDLEKNGAALTVSCLIIDFSLSLFSLLVNIASNTYLRNVELQADSYAVELGYGEDLYTAFDVCLKDSHKVHPHVIFVYGDHPCLETRKVHIRQILSSQASYGKPQKKLTKAKHRKAVRQIP